MTVTLRDASRARHPSSGGTLRLGIPANPRSHVEEILARFRRGGMAAATSFHVASRGGYARTVTGTITFLDEEAETFMVLEHDGRVVRVPLGDITSTTAA